MSERTDTPRIFISYSWTTPQYEARIINFAERLTADGIDVVLDKWDLKTGQDKYVFMEQMVSDPRISRVLMLCDKATRKKLTNERAASAPNPRSSPRKFTKRSSRTNLSRL